MNVESRIETPAADLSPYLHGRSFANAWEQFQEDGYVIFPEVLTPDQIEQQRAALKPWIEADIRGRNNFEGDQTNRIYGMLDKDPVFADLISHPLQLAFAERELGQSCLLYACLAINLHPGETVQPWHFDDSHCGLARPRDPLSLSTFWSISETTETNGATEIIPGSHKWGKEQPTGANRGSDFKTGVTDKKDGSKDIAERVWEKDRFWGYQIEIDPSERAWTGTLYEEGGRGFLHSPDEAKAPEGTFKAEDWNQLRIVVKGDHFQVWLNGVQTADVHDHLTPTGYIALQLHGIGKSKDKIGQKVRWRNIRLKSL